MGATANLSWCPAKAGDAEWMSGKSRTRLAPALTADPSWMDVGPPRANQLPNRSSPVPRSSHELPVVWSASWSRTGTHGPGPSSHSTVSIGAPFAADGGPAGANLYKKVHIPRMEVWAVAAVASGDRDEDHGPGGVRAPLPVAVRPHRG